MQALAAVSAATAVLACLALRHEEARSPAGVEAAAAPAATSLKVPSAPGRELGKLGSGDPAPGATLDAAGHHVLVTALCTGDDTGDDTVTVLLSDGSGTVLTCAPGTPGMVMLRSAGVLHSFTCSTTTTGTPRWALAVVALAPQAP